MSKITYGTVEECYRIGNEERVSYGIVACADAEELGSACVVAAVRDLSSDRDLVERTAKQCNQLGLDPIHLPDLAEDLL